MVACKMHRSRETRGSSPQASTFASAQKCKVYGKTTCPTPCRTSEKQGERVDRNEDARHHAQIAEVRQGVGQVVLPYTLHFCADAKVDACGGGRRASRLLAFYSQPWQRNPSPARTSGPGGSPSRFPSSSSATPPRSVLTGASRPKTSGRRSRTRACFKPSGS